MNFFLDRNLINYGFSWKIDLRFPNFDLKKTYLNQIPIILCLRFCGLYPAHGKFVQDLTLQEKNFYQIPLLFKNQKN